MKLSSLIITIITILFITAACCAEETPMLKISPRYYRWHVDPGVEWTEANTRYANLDWEIPLDQCVLVLVDVWNSHYLKETRERTETIMADYVMPTVTAARSAKMPIIHCPAPGLAKAHPNWVKLATPDDPNPNLVDSEWPPADFKNSTGAYKKYARPVEPREVERRVMCSKRDFHPLLNPIKGEPVVATGEELHKYCKKSGILFLIYAGFNTNACILLRDYGTIAMSNRGYRVLILREAGTGMESYETTSELQQTKNAILFLEMYGKYSLGCQELIDALKKP